MGNISSRHRRDASTESGVVATRHEEVPLTMQVEEQDGRFPILRMIGTIPSGHMTWRDALRTFCNLLLNSIDDNTVNRPTVFLSSNDIVRYTMIPRYETPSPRTTTIPQICLSDDWFCHLVRAFKEHNENRLAISRSFPRRSTLLHLVARMNFPLATREILRHDLIPIDTQDNKRNTPLMEAARFASLEALSVLVDFGADTRTKNEDEDSVLHILVSFPDCSRSGIIVKCIEYLIHYDNVMINAVDRIGNTPLHRACVTRGNRENIIACLVREGADCTIKNNMGETPILTYLKFFSKVYGRQPSHLPAIYSNGGLFGLRALFEMTPKFTCMLRDKQNRLPSIIRTERFRTLQDVFLSNGPQTLQSLTIDAVRRFIGMREILGETRAWRKLRIPRGIRDSICDRRLRKMLQIPG